MEEYFDELEDENLESFFNGQPSGSNNQPTNKKRKKCDFSSSEKQKLALTVKENEAIWKLDSKLHRNNHAVTAQWNAVAVLMKKPVEDCKLAWKSLRDSMRYRSRSKPKKKSGSAASDVSNLDGDVEECCEDDNIDWEFSHCMSFMNTLSSQTRRRTISSSTTVDDPNDIEIDLVSSPNSNYSYMNEKKKQDPLIDCVQQMVENVDKLLNKEKEKKQKLTYGVMLQNLDRMLSQLPKNIVEDLNMKFISLTYEEIKKQNNKS